MSVTIMAIGVQRLEGYLQAIFHETGQNLRIRTTHRIFGYARLVLTIVRTKPWLVVLSLVS